MGKFGITKNGGYVIKWLLCGVLSLAYGGVCFSQELQTVVVKNLQQSPIQHTQSQLPNRSTHFSKNRYIVKLREPAVSTHLSDQVKAAKQAGALGKTVKKVAFSSSAAKSYRKGLVASQQTFSAKVRREAPSVLINKTYQSLLNGLSITANANELAKLKAMPEVAAIYPNNLRYVHLDSSHQVIGTAGAWEYLGGQSEAGKGIKIAIIDSGIRNDNPMFFDQGFSPIDLSDNLYLQQNPDYCRSAQGDPSFCNNKIVLARWVDPIEHDLLGIDPGEHMSPLGLNRHGSHVAGIAAGNEVNVEFEGVAVDLVGVAPGSYLMIYKALFSSGGSTFGSDSMLLEALEHAVNDGADVINNSWGSLLGESAETSIYAEVFANAEAMGITIVSSAGNGGESQTGSINCPGCIESGITVANTSHGRFFAHKLTVDGVSYVADQGENDELAQNLNLTLRSFSELGVTFSDGCDYPFTDESFTDSVILVDYRGTCTLSQVAENVATAGGNAVIIYQSGVVDSEVRKPFEPYTDDYPIPVLGVSRATGLTFFNLANGGDYTISIEADVSLNVDPLFADTFNRSSSTGPNVNASVLKPDLAAPGSNILSAGAPKAVIDLNPFDPFNPLPGAPGIPGAEEIDDSPVFEMISGTSMSAPHVAGAAALLKQAHPTWSPKQIKSALTSTANKNILSGDKIATPFAVGAGRMDLNAAIDAKLSFEQVSFANGACIGACYFATTITNMAELAATWQASLSFENDAINASLNREKFTFSAHSQNTDSAQIQLEIDTSLVEPGTWVFGELILTHAEHAPQHLPLAIYANDNSDLSILSSSVDLSDVQGEFPVTVTVRNYDLATDSALRIVIPNNLNFVQGSETVAINRGSTESIEFDQSAMELHWQGNVLPGEMQLSVEQPWGNTSLASLDVPAVSCNQGCGSFSALVDFNFSFNGLVYNSLAVSSNGFVVPGANSIDPINMSNAQELPQQDSINGVIAPLWAAYDLLDMTNDNDSGGGYLRTVIRTIEGVNFLIVEWDRVELFGFDAEEGDDSEAYTFQLIIEENTDNIWFNYLSIPSMPYSASIGAEDKEGLVGVNHYFLGEGISLPTPISAEGYTYKLNALETGEANISFALSLGDNQSFSASDKVEVAEDTSINIDVLENDSGPVSAKIDLSLDTENNTYQVSRLVKLKNETTVDPLSLDVTQPPEFGSVSISDGMLMYQPNDDYFGTDTFHYKVADDSGRFSSETPVEVAVIAVNDTPELSVDAEQSIQEGEEVTLTAHATDVDSTEFEYHWVQTAGLIVPFTQVDNTITFIAPKVSNGSLINFDVTVSDGDTTSVAVSSKLTVVRKDGGGIWLWGVLFLIALLFSRRVVEEH